jgi:hypothetical protein
MLFFAFHACTHMVAAGDTWVAMACGRHFVNHGVDTVEPFSANSHHAGPTEEDVAAWPGWARWITDKVGLDTVRKWHPTGWVNQNWLTHVMFYKLATTFGSKEDPAFNALVVWKFALYILAIAAVYATARLLGVEPILAALFSCFALFIGRSFIDVRPAGFSNLLVAVFILVLTLTSYRHHLYIWLIVPIVVFWANVHGGYLYAFIALVPFVGWHVLMRLPRRWTIAVYSILTWLVLYVLSHQCLQLIYDLSEKYLRTHRADDPTLGGGMVVLLMLMIGGSIAACCYRVISDRALMALHVTASCILFLGLLTRFFHTPDTVSKQIKAIFATSLDGARLAYIAMFTLALVLGIVTLSLRERTVRVLSWRAIGHTVGAGAVAFVAMVIFNPFHLTNLTHTFEISVSEHAERWRDVHEWHPALDWTNPVGTAIPFLVMYIMAWLALIAWAVLEIRAAQALYAPTKKKAAFAEAFAGTKIDFALLVVAAMTVYMAIRSRRFIPIAGLAAAPVLALLIQRIVTAVLALVALRRDAGAPAPAQTSAPTLAPDLGRAVSRALMLGIGGALLVLGFWRFFLWQWLFLPVPQDRALVQPRDWLTVPGVILAFVAFPALAALYLPWSRRPRSDEKTLAPHPFARPAWIAVALILTSAVLGFGAWVGYRFKIVYLDYWPADPKLTSIFMRMTASDAKPFYACRFIRDNKLSGNMFNYWTEGGFIAWGQEPDPNTGKTPLQLFMDGRAQAAYDTRTFDLWTSIMSGGPTAQRATFERRVPNTREYRQIGQWVSERLARYNVWVFMMPNNQFDKPIVNGLAYTQNWRTVFMNNKQKIFVDVETEKGRKLYEGMFTGATTYPDEFSENLSIGHNMLLMQDTANKKEGLDRVLKAFELDPSPAPVLELLLIAAQFPELRPQVDQFCARYTTDFEDNKEDKYAGKDGYNLRLEAARLCLLRIEQVAKARNDTEAAEGCVRRMTRYIRERNAISDRKRW